jgi:hypothetical protein
VTYCWWRRALCGLQWRRQSYHMEHWAVAAAAYACGACRGAASVLLLYIFSKVFYTVTLMVNILGHSLVRISLGPWRQSLSLLHWCVCGVCVCVCVCVLCVCVCVCVCVVCVFSKVLYVMTLHCKYSRASRIDMYNNDVGKRFIK